MHVHVSYRKNYIRTPGVHSSRVAVFYRKTRASSGAFNFRKDCFCRCCVIKKRETDRQRQIYRQTETETEKRRNRVMPLVRTERLIKQSIKLSLTEKIISGPVKLKDAICLRLKVQCTIYSVVQIFRLVKVIQRKALCRETVEEIQLQTKKEFFSKLLNKSILTQINCLILQFWKKWWKKNWVVIMFYKWFKQFSFVDPIPYRYSNADYVTTNKW